MASVLIDTQQDIELAPGQTTHRWWNNAKPSDAVWYVQAVPRRISPLGVPVAEDVSVEVVRVWRRFISQGAVVPDHTHTEHEIHYEVKNVGNEKCRFNVLLSVIS